MSELFQETKKLNELMTSYIRVQMNEEMAKEVTIHNQLNQIQETADEIIKKMHSILNKQEKTFQEKSETLQEILINGHEQLQETTRMTVKAIEKFQEQNNMYLQEIHNELNTSMKQINRNIEKIVRDAEQKTLKLVSNAKHGAFITHWIDALKYGAATSIITVPILYFLLN